MTMTNAELENEIKALKTQITSLQGTVSNKADATAVSALNARVTSHNCWINGLKYKTKCFKRLGCIMWTRITFEL
ncbi:hypothetical protein [Acinetobacter baumannii]|uniref:hypothetical protein n=1 Tax=Acinetobacter baumannii TaxID=470 RepID=UPI00241D35D4|nr:hypothetical protein [Acinetobacter baumannii]MDG5643619.1 hypothetical protein [Acinetobacter baumannii]MDG5647619.1 hypothetical protein [Acinetobacter baumannii]MDG5692941.1 hypothetical protein [Acinetobacter baumannii]MDG5726675.1 hypothetical protein [Acinetobacter baumannii]MDG5738366.1 hypothetical protein [Acinetobacter baumannii]